MIHEGVVKISIHERGNKEGIKMGEGCKKDVKIQDVKKTTITRILVQLLTIGTMHGEAVNAIIIRASL